MPYAAFTRLSGYVVLFTGALTILFNAFLWTGIIPRTFEYPGYLVLQTLFLFSLVSILILHIQRPGILLVTGFVLALVDNILGAGFSYYASFAFPILRAQFPDAVPAVLGGPLGAVTMVSMGLGILGNLLFYAGVLRAAIVPRWAPVVMIGSQVISLAMLPFNIPVIIACVGLVGIGFAMTSMKPSPAPVLKPQPIA
jgi:hypothetical protein